MKTEAARCTSKFLGDLAVAAVTVNAGLEAIPYEIRDRKEIAEALARSRAHVEQAHEDALMALELLERAERHPKPEATKPEATS